MKQKIQMCAPDFFGVDYVINPWMVDNQGRTDRALAAKQWTVLRDHLERFADIVYVTPQPGLPDMVFTANAGLVLGNKVVVSRFKAPERQGEEPFFRDWFAAHGFELVEWPGAVPFEGAGDALLDRGQQILWAAWGFRSDKSSLKLLDDLLGRKTLGLHLVDPHFYHLDTCFCPLTGGYLLWYPAAFDDESCALVEATIPATHRIAVEEADAVEFSCNAVDLAQHIFMNHASEGLQDQLRAIGFTPIITPLSEYMKSGGAAKCLTLKLVEN